jgi:hypothetical protein
VYARLAMAIASAMMLQLASSSGAVADSIHTGGRTGAYHSDFCPLLKTRLSAVGGSYTCSVSAGSSENLRHVAATPTDFGFSQFDVYALESRRFGGEEAFAVVRSDDARECVFAVTRNKDLTNFGQIAVNADRLRFVLPPRSSGSASTFEFLGSIDPTGLGRARQVSHAADTDEAIRRTLDDEQAVTFFVQFPDPNNERFRAIRRMGGHLVPVIDGVLLSQRIDGEPVYFAQETEIEQQRWLRAGRNVITACTPLVLFTGNPNRITNADARLAHRQLIENIKTLPTADIVPQGTVFARLLKQTRTASSRARDHFLRLSEEARLQARPFLERMWRMASNGVHVMIEKAQPQR